MPLTDAKIRSAKPRPKKYKLSDANGLQLHVLPSGTRVWRYSYRHNGKQREATIGPYPLVPLQEAREKHLLLRKQVLNGQDPCREKQRERMREGATFAKVAEEYVAKNESEGYSAKTLRKNRYLLDKFLLPRIGTLNVTDIEAIDVLPALRDAETRGLYNSALRSRQLAGRILRFAVSTGRAKADVTAGLKDALTVSTGTHRAAIFDLRELGGFLRAVDSYQGHASTRYALLMLPYVFVRPGELRKATWPEFDLDAALWRIPAKRMKERRDHLVPLSPCVLGLLSELRPITGDGTYLFPSVRTNSRPISDNTLNAAMRRMGYAKDEVCAHGFRRTASTILNEEGFNKDWVERQLAHVEGNQVRGAYNAAEYLDARREMMEWYSRHLEELKNTK